MSALVFYLPLVLRFSVYKTLHYIRSVRYRERRGKEYRHHQILSHAINYQKLSFNCLYSISLHRTLFKLAQRTTLKGVYICKLDTYKEGGCECHLKYIEKSPFSLFFILKWTKMSQLTIIASWQLFQATTVSRPLFVYCMLEKKLKQFCSMHLKLHSQRPSFEIFFARAVD